MLPLAMGFFPGVLPRRFFRGGFAAEVFPQGFSRRGFSAGVAKHSYWLLDCSAMCSYLYGSLGLALFLAKA